MNLPYLTSDIPALGGEIKQTADEFTVEEIPSYLPSGSGQHFYLKIKRQNMNTDDVIKVLKNLFAIPEKEIGKAGLKDRNATTIQTFSLSLGANFPIETIKSTIAKDARLELLSVDRHINKIKTGHLKGNRFWITINDINPDLQAIEKIVEQINKGIPNFFGEQRFGSKGDNAARGLRILKGEKEMNHHMEKLMLSALQSELFNQYLVKRLNQGQLFEKLEGDVVIYQEATGPLFGDKMLLPSGAPSEWEKQVLQENNLTLEDFSHPLIPGGRRAIVLIPEELKFELKERQLFLSFILPKGAYATQITREFTKG